MSSLTFGPEWLRALSSGDSGASPPAPATVAPAPVKYKLAEFRYGREEMLALFCEDLTQPVELKSFEELMRDRPGQPLAFQSLSEEEERSVHGGVNSVLALKMMSRTPGRGRGAVRGGRGRSRGDGGPTFHRSLSNDDSYVNRGDTYGRRSWIETGGRGMSSERGRGGMEGPGQGRILDPRRSFSDVSPRGNAEPWRSPGAEEEEGPGWRATGQRTWRKTAMADTSQNWREDRSKDKDGDGQPRERAWGRSNHENDDTEWKSAIRSDSLPEWCNDDDDDVDSTPGTFDDSGQFRYHKDKNNRTQSLEKDENSISEKSSLDIKQDSEMGSRKSPTESSSLTNKEDNSPKDLKDNIEINFVNSNESRNNEIVIEKQPVARSDAPVVAETVTSNEPINNVTGVSETPADTGEGLHNNRLPQSPENVNGQIFQSVTTGSLEEDLELKMHDMEYIVAKLDEEEEDEIIAEQHHNHSKHDIQTIQDPSILFAKKAEPGTSTVKVILDWIYRDPQGEIQGPFPSEEMLDWFKAGYFDTELLVRRVCDEVFLPLGDVIKLWGRVPFLPGAAPPPISSQVLAAAQQAQRQQYEKLSHRHVVQRTADISPTQHLQQQLQQQQQQQLQRQQLQQQQQLKQQQQMRQVLLQQLQVKSTKPLDSTHRPQNLNIIQEVSIWGDSPVQSPRAEQSVWNNKNSPQSVVELHKLEDEQRLVQKNEDLSPQDSLPVADESLATDNLSPMVEASNIQVQQQQHEKNIPTVDNEKEVAQRIKLEQIMKEEEELAKKKQRAEAQRRALESLQKNKLEQQRLLEQKKREEEDFKRQQQEELRRHQEQQQQLQQLQARQRQQQQQRQMEMARASMNETSPTWDIPTTSAAPSLLAIQRLEEDKQRAVLEKLQHLQAQQQLQQQQQQQQRSYLAWAAGQSQPSGNVKSLAEIQKEEAILAKERAAKYQKQQQHRQQLQSKNYSYSSGVWNNTMSHSESPNPSSTSGMFWDDVMNVPSHMNGSAGYRRSASKNNGFGESAFPSLANTNRQVNRKSKDEEVVHRLFQPSSPSEEFSQWVQSKLPSLAKNVDVPTFVNFLQSIDSPYELRDYIQKYLGDNPDSRAFTKHFTDFQKRQNEAKKTVKFSSVSRLPFYYGP